MDHFSTGLGACCARRGRDVWRVGFNRGDEFFWRDRASYIPYTGTPKIGPQPAADLLDGTALPTLRFMAMSPGPCRGDRGRTGARHYRACVRGRLLRPYWVTYERDGSNGNSALMRMSVDDMRRALEKCDLELPDPPAHWGDMRHHIFYGAIYHFCVMALNRAIAISGRIAT